MLKLSQIPPFRHAPHLIASAFAASCVVGASDAATILALGDSITYGLNDENAQTTDGGYRAFLDASYGNIDWVGPYGGSTDNPGTDAIDESDGLHPDPVGLHFGVPGAEAQNGQNGNPSLNANNYQNFFTANQPDAILVHIGTNTLAHTSSGGVSERLVGSSFMSNPVEANLGGMLGDLHTMSPESEIFVARIIPRTPSDARPQGLRDAARYNYDDSASSFSFRADELDAIDGFTVVDMYAIPLSMLDLTTSELALAGSDKTDGEGGLDDGYVDWFTNINEGAVVAAAGGYDTSDFDTAEFNPNLLYDGIHPTELGYKIMAQVFGKALEAQGLVAIPEPASLALLSLGMGAIMMRRRREA